MNRISNAVLMAFKVLLVGITFFACFAVTIPVVSLTVRLFPNAHFAVHFFPAIPLMGMANRFVLLPLEYYLNVRSFQYDPWFENRRNGKIAQQSPPGDVLKAAPEE